MKHRTAAALLAAFALFLAGCTAGPLSSQPPQEELILWFPTVIGSGASSALGQEPRLVASHGQTAREALRALFAGPASAELVSPFPADTVLRSVTIQDGLAVVDLSEAYGGLSGVDLTLADACVVLTLCQFPEIQWVYITVEGRERPFRDQILSQDDYILDNAG